MAEPRVFISSTCYDLADERDGLSSFCDGFGFSTALSERGDIFYHPDLHTHVSCVREISTCHLFVLIVGGRFGGKYISDKAKSITNAEYSAAREMGLPVFAFVKQDVLNDHNIWQRNKDQPFAKDIHYPSIDKQEHAIDIFNFIDQVRLAPSNNGLFGFRLSREIFELLRKQWSSMFFEYLQSRSFAKQISTTNEALASLSAASTKIEEIVRKIYKNVDEFGAPEALSAIDQESRAKELLLTMAARTGDRRYLVAQLLPPLAKDPPAEWPNFFAQGGFFKIDTKPAADGTPTLHLTYTIGGEETIAKLNGELNKLEKAELQYFAEGYQALKSLPFDVRTRILSEYAYSSPPSPSAVESTSPAS